MSTDDRRRHLQLIIDRHNDLARAFRRTADAIDAAQEALEASGRALRDATHAQREAIDAMLAANVAVVELWTPDQE